MEWNTRTLEELLATEPLIRPGTNESMVIVNADEGRTLVAAGASISSGSENLERNTQRYRINDKTYLWLAGYPTGNWEDEFPINQVDPRLREVLRAAKEAGI